MYQLSTDRFFFGLQNAFLVYMCECLVDTVKHAFLAKFNEIKPDAYSDFLEDLCKQVNLALIKWSWIIIK